MVVDRSGSTPGNAPPMDTVDIDRSGNACTVFLLTEIVSESLHFFLAQTSYCFRIYIFHADLNSKNQWISVTGELSEENCWKRYTHND